MSVLLVETGPDDQRDSMRAASAWPQNLGTDAVYDFVADPEAGVGGRSLPYPTGRGLGGGGSVNACTWARGHQADWDSYAQSTGDARWDYEHVLDVYRRIESYQGAVDERRGVHGPMWIEQPTRSVDLFDALLEGGEQAGLRRFASTNGELMESSGGVAVRDQNIRDGLRQSPFSAYVRPDLDSGTLTVLQGTGVAEVRFNGQRAAGVRLDDGTDVTARHEVVLSAGAIGTALLLMRSGIGDERQLIDAGVPVRVHAPAVGQHLHDHVMVAVVFEARHEGGPLEPGVSDIGMFWNLLPEDEDPPVVVYVDPEPSFTPEAALRVPPPQHAVSLLVGVRTQGRGEVRLDPRDPSAAPRLRTGFLAREDERRAVVRAVERVRQIAASEAASPFLGPLVYPRAGSDMVEDICAQAGTFWHQSGTARMGMGSDAVLSPDLRVLGFDGFRVADSSALPHVTVANTMAPCMVVGEVAADAILGDLGSGRSERERR